MKNNNGPLKARMYIGGLKSLFVDMAETLDEVEKTGSITTNMINTLQDIKQAIDLTLQQLNELGPRCCQYAPDCDGHEDEDDEENWECNRCGDDENDCDCEDDEDDEEPAPVKKPKVKVVSSKKPTKH
jgi:hypothetical protein